MNTTIEELDSPLDVLVFVREQRRVADAAEAAVLRGAATWAEQHPPESIDEAATWTGGAETSLFLAGPGAPTVAEFCIAEFALAIGRSTDAGRAYIATAVELKYRLPKLWSRINCGDLPVWRARRVAEATVLLTKEAAAFVDTQVAPFAHKIGFAELERLVEEAKKRYMPEQAKADAEKSADGRHVKFHHDHVTFNGTTRVEGELDLADALDLDAALSQGAEQLALCGSTQSLDVRRALAAGELARRQLALDLNHRVDEDDAADATPGWPSSERSERTVETTPATRKEKPAKPRQVVLHVHLSESAVRGGEGLHLARVENTRTGVTADQIKTWVANPDTVVTVKPVIDLNDHIHVNAYEVPDRLAEQTQLRDHTCVFPWCTRRARRCDSDHCVAAADGGTTCSCNIAPLCRRHHRLKTHTAWTYTPLEPGSYLWRSPHGYQFLRDHTGTLDVTPDRLPPGPAESPHFY